MCLEKRAWLHPLSIAAQIPKDEESFVLLYSGMQTSHTGRYSLLALKKQEEITGEFSKLEEKLTKDDNSFNNAWFGYLGYGLKNQLEKLGKDTASFINTPDLWFARYGLILVFDHTEQHIEIWGEREGENDYLIQLHDILQLASSNITHSATSPSPVSVFSNMSRTEYLEKVNYIKDAIKRGDLYQANLTRKFFGEINGKVSAFDIFTRLCLISPAPYSAFIKSGNLHVISSSPERFLHVDKHGNANTRPIKGSAARDLDPKRDQTSINNLKASEKDRAENLMIVDLSRNDLARNCEMGTITVDELFNVETYATVHHMVSSVSGLKKKGSSTLELIKGCFPPGSMTGTPKIKAMEICSKLEQLNRGIYAGSIGWFGGDASADLSVVIRTIILQGNKFEFQVGGAIVNDSDAKSEFIETMLKAKGVASALGISINRLEEL